MITKTLDTMLRYMTTCHSTVTDELTNVTGVNDMCVTPGDSATDRLHWTVRKDIIASVERNAALPHESTESQDDDGQPREEC